MSLILSGWSAIANWWLSWFLWLLEVGLAILLVVVLLLMIPGAQGVAIAGIPVWIIIVVIVVIVLFLWVVLALFLAVVFFVDLFLNFLVNWRRIGCRYAWRRLVEEFWSNNEHIRSGVKQAFNDAAEKLPGARWVINKLSAAADGLQKIVDEAPTYWKGFKKWLGFKD